MMKRALFILGVVCVGLLTLIFGMMRVGLLTASDEKLVRELNIKPQDPDTEFNFPGVVVTDATELKKHIKDEKLNQAITKVVDFKTEKIILFGWSGSGGDKILFKLSEDKKTVVFSKQPGITDDLRHHFRVFAVPKPIQIEKN